MNKKTSFCFFGEILNEFPELMINSYKMTMGDKVAWVNASCKLATSVGDIIKLHIDKNNTRILQTEVDKLDAECSQENLEQEFLAKKLEFVREIQSEFVNHQKELQIKYTKSKFLEYETAIAEQKAFEQIETCVLSGLKRLIEMCDEELSNIEKGCEFNSNEKINLEEIKRLLYQQYIKHIKTEV